jgi:hypothetical protein
MWLRTAPAPHVYSIAAQGNPERPSGIEGVEMRNVYYNPVRNFTIFLSLLAPGVIILAALPARPHSSPQAASTDSHEGLTISAVPWTDGSLYREKFPKKSPFSAGVVAVHVEFRNNSDESMRVNLRRIRLTVQLDSDNKQEVQSLTSEELADAVIRPTAKDPTATRQKLPIPLPTSKGGRDKHWMELQKQAQEAEVPSSVVAAHGSVQGLLYFDLQDQFDLLQTAHLYIPEVMLMQQNRALTYFDIDLSRHSAQ